MVCTLQRTYYRKSKLGGFIYRSPVLIGVTQILLSPTGCFYLVTVSQNKPAEIMQRMEQDYGLISKVTRPVDYLKRT